MNRFFYCFHFQLASRIRQMSAASKLFHDKLYIQLTKGSCTNADLAIRSGSDDERGDYPLHRQKDICSLRNEHRTIDDPFLPFRNRYTLGSELDGFNQF